MPAFWRSRSRPPWHHPHESPRVPWTREEMADLATVAYAVWEAWAVRDPDATMATPAERAAVNELHERLDEQQQRRVDFLLREGAGRT